MPGPESGSMLVALQGLGFQVTVLVDHACPDEPHTLSPAKVKKTAGRQEKDGNNWSFSLRLRARISKGASKVRDEG